jgi:hypothetical protein
MCDAQKTSLMDRSLDYKLTVNGHPATICGRLNPFAMVVALDGSGVKAEYAWDTVKRILDKAAVTGRAEFKA